MRRSRHRLRLPRPRRSPHELGIHAKIADTFASAGVRSSEQSLLACMHASRPGFVLSFCFWRRRGRKRVIPRRMFMGTQMSFYDTSLASFSHSYSTSTQASIDCEEKVSRPPKKNQFEKAFNEIMISIPSFFADIQLSECMHRCFVICSPATRPPVHTQTDHGVYIPGH